MDLESLDQMHPGLRQALERNVFEDHMFLSWLERNAPERLLVNSLDPLTMMAVMAPPASDHRSPRPRAVWLRGPALEARRLLGDLESGREYWLSCSAEAAEAVEGWARKIAWQARYVVYTLTPPTFRPSPVAGVRTLADRGGNREWQMKAEVKEFGAEVDGKTVGHCLAIPSYADLWVVGGLAVDQPYRRQGLGKALATAATQFILDRGGRPVYETTDRNVPSRRTCEALGFRLVGEYANFTATAP